MRKLLAQLWLPAIAPWRASSLGMATTAFSPPRCCGCTFLMVALVRHVIAGLLGLVFFIVTTTPPIITPRPVLLLPRSVTAYAYYFKLSYNSRHWVMSNKRQKLVQPKIKRQPPSSSTFFWTTNNRLEKKLFFTTVQNIIL